MSLAQQLYRATQERLVGQEYACQEIVRGLIPRLFTDFSGEKTLGSFLMVGPDGTGKTRLAECLAEFFLGHADRLIRLNSLLLQPVGHKLRLGSTPHLAFPQSIPGGSPDQLVQHVFLLENVERSSKTLIDFWNSILTRGCLPLESGPPISFQRSIFLLKSAIGEREPHKGANVVGFGGLDVNKQDGEHRERIDRVLERAFPSRLLSNFTRVVHFRRLRQGDLAEILMRQLGDLLQHFRNRGLEVFLDDSVPEHLLECALERTRLRGAKGIRKVLVDELLFPLQDMQMTQTLRPGDRAWVRAEGGTLQFGLPPQHHPAPILRPVIF